MVELFWFVMWWKVEGVVMEVMGSGCFFGLGLCVVDGSLFLGLYVL